MPRLADPRIAAATANLPANAPDPAAFRYEPAYEAIATEVGKLERSGPASVHWSEVARNGQEILATRSKDLSVATWLALALLQTEQLKGLAVGLAIIRDTIEKFWDILYPKRARARAGALEWLVGHAAREIPETFAPELGPAASAAREELEALEALLQQKQPDSNVSLGELLRPLRRLDEAALRAGAEAEQKKLKDAALATPATPPPAAAPTAVPATLVPSFTATSADPERSFSALREGVRTAALALMEANLAEPRSFHLLGSVTWLDVTELPPTKGGHTELLAPPETRRTEFAALESAGNHKELVLALERFCSGSGLFWLDGQRLAAAALGALGAAYAGSARAVIQSVQTLLERLPGLAQLAFADGTSFADGATRAWITTRVLARADAKQAEEPAAVAPWQSGLDQARQKLASGEGKAALTLLGAGVASAPNERAKSYWRLCLAHFWLENGNATLALPLLQQLIAEIDAHGLEAWEPKLAAEAALLLHRCTTLPDITKSVPEAMRADIARAAFARMARTDPLLAAQAAEAGRA